MTSAQIGYAVGMFLAAGGCGYLLIGLLKLIRVYRRWPRGSYVAACLFVLLLGLITASAGSGSEVWIAIVATIAAAGFLAWQGPMFKKAAA